MSPAAYPAEQSVDVALRDGSTVHVRPVRPEDEPALTAFLESMSPDSLYMRCFGAPNIKWLAHWSADVDYADRYGLVVTGGGDGAVLAHAAYVRTSEAEAEVAFEVADHLHGHGIATLLLAHLAGVAVRHGITTFTAAVLPSNHKMIEVFRDSGFPIQQHTEEGVTVIEFPTALLEEALEAFEHRQHVAAVQAIGHFLKPASVALIGASGRPDTVGRTLLRKLVDGGFTGQLQLVNRKRNEIDGLPCYPSARELPDPPELAVIAVPAADVVAAAQDCGLAGARAIVVISAGFAETGADGAARQQELLQTCREFGMRLIGPNCLGVLNTDPAVRLDATFAAHGAPAGRIGFLSQSGGLGIALMEAADRLGLGLSSFVSVGNKADISGNDLLEYWEQDGATGVILLYLESFGNPRRFARVARRVSRSKPILAVKSGRTPAGARATSSHTGAMLSASDVTVDALFAQAGVIRADTIGELLDTAALLSEQPLPRGNRVAIVTNGGGPGIVCADACQAAGLDVVELGADVRERLASFLPADAALANPVDMIATATAADYRRVIEELVAAGACDAIVTLFVPPLMTAAADVRREIGEAAHGAGPVTLASVYMDRSDSGRVDRDGVLVPNFAFPEDSVRALAHAVRYSEWLARPRGAVRESDPRARTRASEVIERALAAGAEWLEPADVTALFESYGLPIVRSRIVRGAGDAVAAAAELGGPVAIKAIATGLIHKTDAGAVRLGVEGDAAVRAAVREIGAAVSGAGHRLEGLLIQPMVEPGVELLLGVVHDESFGPVIACGAGGVNAELLGDVAVKITPLSDIDAAEMLRGLRSFPLLCGYRAQPVCDIAAVERALLGLSELVEAHPEVVELDANPVIAAPGGAVIVDARVRVARAMPPRPLGSLRS
jgi:acetyl coenzyme A synthetase (ADP forming)-like protein